MAQRRPRRVRPGRRRCLQPVARHRRRRRAGRTAAYEHPGRKRSVAPIPGRQNTNPSVAKIKALEYEALLSVIALVALFAPGARLAAIHVGYEEQPEYGLRQVETPDKALDWRVEKMRLSKDKSQLRYNSFLMLDGIPTEAFEYRLGHRSALE